MRLSVDLSKYFSDHRSLAYIFVNKKTMQHIKDVEERISRIFIINNFFLIQQNHYLPSLEEISILDEAYDLCVIPLNQTNCILSDDCVTKKKKRNKEKKEKIVENNEDEMVKKTRKRKLNVEENHINDNDPELKSDKSQDEFVKKKSKIDKKSNTNQNQIVYAKRRETFQEHLDKILVKKDEIINRSPNIVKTIIVSANNLTKPNYNNNKVLDSSTDSSSSTETLVSFNNNNKEEEEEEEINEQPKRRRRRTRTRKRKRIVNNEETIPQHPNDTENITPKLCLPKPTGLHIRFSDDGQIEQKKIVQETQVEQQEIVEKVKIVENTDSNTIINKINDDFILKQPLVVDISPKLNDLIAFKILRLNAAYTPELSPFIIGKVIAFNSDDKEITFDVKQGLDYCLPPQGKFSIEDEAIEVETSVHTFKWSDLVEPRLIYP